MMLSAVHMLTDPLTLDAALHIVSMIMCHAQAAAIIYTVLLGLVVKLLHAHAADAALHLS